MSERAITQNGYFNYVVTPENRRRNATKKSSYNQRNELNGQPLNYYYVPPYQIQNNMVYNQLKQINGYYHHTNNGNNYDLNDNQEAFDFNKVKPQSVQCLEGESDSCNYIIDLFCKEGLTFEELYYIFDLEIGHPRHVPNRPIALYDPEHRKVVIRSDPSKVHPFFAKCSTAMQQLLTSHYETCMLTWHKMYKKYYPNNTSDDFMAWVVPLFCKMGIAWNIDSNLI